MNFQILTNETICAEPRLSNLKLLHYHDKASLFTANELSEWLDIYSLMPAQTIAGAEALLGDLAKVYRLIAAGHLSCDLEGPISGDTTISLTGKELMK